MKEKLKTEVFVYKSNVKSKNLAKIVLSKLSEKFPKIESSFDLEDRDKVYRLESTLQQKKEIETFLKSYKVELSEF